MKKLFTLLLTTLMAISVALPVFAQDTGSQEAPKSDSGKMKKEKKSKKSKKKSTGEAPKSDEAPKQ
jgi:hypothetical protein